MSEGDQGVEDLGQLIICPYDSSHRVTAARMGHHLIKCRENFPISEKAICPFNGKHEVFAPEMDYHQSVCPHKSGETKIQQYISDGIDVNGENPKDKLFGSFSSETSFTFSSCEANATGCESGLDPVGGIQNFIEETDETGKIAFNTPNGENRQPQKRLSEDCDDVAANELVLPIVDESASQSIEKQLEQSESDTTSSETNSSVGNDERFFEEERFDYTKYIPSKDLREDFLKLIGQPRNGQVYEAKCQSASQPFAMHQWPQDYSILPAPFQTSNGYQTTGIQPTFVSFSNTYNVIPPVASCPIPYGSSYGFHNQTPGASFLQTTPGQPLGYEYTVYPAARPNYYRSYHRRRNHYNFSRNNNHKSYNSHNHGNQAETFLNGFNHPENGLDENNCYVNKLNGTENHDEMGTSHSMCMNNGCDKEQPLLSAKLRKDSFCVKENKDSDVDEQQFVGINDIPDKQLIGDAKGERLVSYHDSQDAIKKSEIEKQIRKIKKKLAEINGLEDKYRKGASLDCDQLKKLSRKSEFEDQLQSLSLS